jgi:hypothetical protein
MKSLLQRGIAAFTVLLMVAVFVPTSANAEGYSWSGSFATPVYAQSWGGYQHQYFQLQQLIELLKKLQAQLRALQDRDDDDDDDNSDEDAEVEVTTLTADNIGGDEARLRGEIDFNDSEEAYVWFEWGEDDDDLDEETTRVFRDEDDDEEFTARIRDLDEDQEYFFRAVGEDEDGNIDRGSIRRFETDEDGNDNDDDNDNNDEEPEVETGDAEDITDDSVEIHGEIDMNDFENGIVFFVWGEDEDQVGDIEDDYDTYDDVDEDGDDLQKLLVDSDHDGSASFTADLSGLDNETEYFYNICVEYEDEDDDETILCGSVESFETED